MTVQHFPELYAHEYPRKGKGTMGEEGRKEDRRERKGREEEGSEEEGPIQMYPPRLTYR